jgi:hypothetical protein
MCDVEGNHLTAAAILGQDGSVFCQIFFNAPLFLISLRLTSLTEEDENFEQKLSLSISLSLYL